MSSNSNSNVLHHHHYNKFGKLLTVYRCSCIAFLGMDVQMT